MFFSKHISGRCGLTWPKRSQERPGKFSKKPSLTPSYNATKDVPLCPLDQFWDLTENGAVEPARNMILDCTCE
jgi:hypothetical protein